MLGAPVIPLGLLGCTVIPSEVMPFNPKSREGLPPPQPAGLVLFFNNVHTNVRSGVDAAGQISVLLIIAESEPQHQFQT